MEPPTVPEDVRGDWTVASDETTTPFSAPGVTVTARTITLEPADSTTPKPFFVASRIALSPWTENPLVDRLLASRARAGFLDRLRDRGFRSLRERGRRKAGEVPLRVYAGRHRSADADTGGDGDDRGVAVEAVVGFRAADRLLVGGAYRSADGTTRERVAEMARRVR